MKGEAVKAETRMKDAGLKKEQVHEPKTEMEEREEEGNFQGHGFLSGSSLSSADGDTHTTHANLHTAHPSGHDGCRT